MSTSSKGAGVSTGDAQKSDQTWKPVPGTEQDIHSQTPGGGEAEKHGTKDPAETKTAHSATRKGEQ